MMFYEYEDDNLEYNNNCLILPAHFLVLHKQPFQLHHTNSTYFQPNVDVTIIFPQGKTYK
jgi:hypothetical protein